MECGQITGWKERLSTRCPGQAQIRSLLRKAPAQSIISLRREQGEMSPQKDAWLQPKGRDLANKGLVRAGKWSMGVAKGFWEGTATSECIHLTASFPITAYTHKPQAQVAGLQWLFRLSGNEEFVFTLTLSLNTFSKQLMDKRTMQMYAPQTSSLNGSCSI